MDEPVAVIADIHGNVWALDALLQDIDRRGLRIVVNLGDSLYGPLEPGLTAERLMARSFPTIRGNQDRILLEPSPPSPTLEYTQSQLSRQALQWLGEQPGAIEMGEYFLCHGTPHSDETYLTETVSQAGAALRPFEHVEVDLVDVKQPVVLCGHSHLPRALSLPGGKLVFNPGSAGLPAYADDLPFPHRMEAGSPHARYGIIQRNGNHWRLEWVALSYDWGAAAAKARKNGREDWAVALSTGWAIR